VSARSVRALAAVAAACAAGMVAGCSSAERPAVEKVATAFEDQSAQAQQRCDLLAPATRDTLEKDASAACADAMQQVALKGGTVRSVQVWGGDAQVQLTGDTVFLTQTPSGWRVTAAGCEPRGEAPYDCDVEGP
jgi:hypothetical protein